ncbi:MAG: redox-sensing transcriptional repressor Rex [Actinomycetota bacterium]|nr:redox-sensing transcriptional repressor Rex [Actinomycetota bacterium]
MSNHVPNTTVQRLPVYLRCLVQEQSLRVPVANSVRIAEMAGTNAAQVRKDLSYLGEYGIRGIGYDVDGLVKHLTRWLGLEHVRKAAIVGYGRLGSALLGYGGFQDRGFSLAAVFDTDPEKIGAAAGSGLVVEPLEDFAAAVERDALEIVVLTVPASVAQAVTDTVVAAGIKAILNFAPAKLLVPADVAVRQADVAAELQILSFHLSSGGE